MLKTLTAPTADSLKTAIAPVRHFYEGRAAVPPWVIETRRAWLRQEAPNLRFRSDAALDNEFMSVALKDTDATLRNLTLYFTDREIESQNFETWEKMAEAAFREMNSYAHELHRRGQPVPGHIGAFSRAHSFFRYGVDDLTDTQDTLLRWAEVRHPVLERMIQADLAECDAAVRASFGERDAEELIPTLDAYLRHLEEEMGRIPGSLRSFLSQAASFTRTGAPEVAFAAQA